MKKTMPIFIRTIIFLTIIKFIISIIIFIILLVKKPDTNLFYSTLEILLPNIVLSILIIIFIFQQNKIGLRICIILDLLSSFGAKAFLGIIISILNFIFTFLSSSNDYLTKNKVLLNKKLK